MFESVDRKGVSGARRAAMLLISVFLHTTMILILVVLPLIYFDILPQPEVLTYLMMEPPPPPPPPAPPPPPPVKRPVLPHSEVVAASGFIAPTEIPKSIPPPGIEPLQVDVPQVSESALGGEPGGVIGGVPSGIQAMFVGPTHLPPPPPPPREMPKASGPLVVSNLQQQSKLMRMVQPAYPLLARRARIQGVVILHIVVDEGGNVIEADVVSGHPLLQEAAVKAVKQWKYSPTVLNDKPIQVATTVSVIFTLQG
jgi:periplasmic protein TonB